MNADIAVRVFLGPGWASIAPVLSVLCIAGIVQVSGYIIYWTLVGSGRPRLLLLSEVFPRLLMIGGIAVCAPHGLLPVAWCIVAGQCLLILTGCGYGLRRLSIRFWDSMFSAFSPTAPFLIATPLVPFILEATQHLWNLTDTQCNILSAIAWAALVLGAIAIPRGNRGLALRMARKFTGSSQSRV
jgi:O-antigen/teichoic acid export membrane protein